MTDIAITWRPELGGREDNGHDAEYYEHKAVAEVKVGRHKQIVVATGVSTMIASAAQQAEAVREARKEVLAMALKLFERTEG